MRFEKLDCLPPATSFLTENSRGNVVWLFGGQNSWENVVFIGGWSSLINGDFCRRDSFAKSKCGTGSDNFRSSQYGQ